VRTIHAVTEGQYYDAVTWRRQDDDKPWWEAGEDFYLGSLDKVAAQELVRATVRFGAQTVREAHARALTPDVSIDLLVSVQPRRWIGKAIVEALGLEVPSPTTYDSLAHLGGSGIVTNLLAAREGGSLGEGTEVTLYAQGAGFTRAAALISW
jgi:3-oxoacyl-[acyl-carrier-protein] synthase III